MKTFSAHLLLFIIIISNITSAQTVEQRIDSLLSEMTLEEKVEQLYKAGAMHTADNTRLDIPGFVMADGPHGVRDGLATSFPVGIAMAATWDVELAEHVGFALGKEFLGKGKHQMLGPAIDLTRDPRNGRTPESGGEDPYLNALINSAVVKGAQSAGIIATAKHYNGKHKQSGRNDNDYSISQRNLLEHYGYNFRTLVQDAGVLSVMSAYNRVNGDQAAESTNLLSNILKDKWGFPFYVVSDWGAVHNSEKAITAGTDICMGSDHYQNDLLNLVNSGNVSVDVINEAVRRVLRTKIISGMTDNYPVGDPSDVNSPEHQALCLEAGKKCLVLLKNQDNVLPLDKNSINKIAVVGPNAAVMQTDGTGSSWVSPFYTVTPKQGIENYVGADKVLYAKGCEISGTNYANDVGAAIQYAKDADVVIYFGGLDPTQEGEGLDRANGSIELPGKQKDFIKLMAQYNQKVIVVLVSGGICGVNYFINDIEGLMQAFYPGQEGGNAIAQVLFGDYNPAGRLPVTLPASDSQLGDEITDFDFNNDYGFGYRWFDEKNLTPEFPFGFGLSYTTFSYSNLVVTPVSDYAGKTFTVTVDVANTGSRAGEEVVQLYLTEDPSYVPKPPKELKGFKRIYLEPGETKTVEFKITPNDFYYYSERMRSYVIDPGWYDVRVGGSSGNLPLKKTFEVRQATPYSDLQIANVMTVPRFPKKGDKVIFLATIINRGVEHTPIGTFHDVLFSVNGKEVSRAFGFTDSIPKCGMALVEGNVGIESNNEFYWTAEEPGEYTIEAWVDDQNSIQESNESNNKKSVTFKVYSAPPVNIALNKIVTVSSKETTGLEGSKAVDGSYTTRWSSQFSDPQYIMIDLGSVLPFDQIRLVWEAAFAKEYRLEVSNDKNNWTEIAHPTNAIGGTEKINIDTSARYIKLTGIKRGTQYGYSLYEIEILQGGNVVSVDDEEKISELPFNFSLGNNYPNPFNPSTTINYNLPKAGNVKIEIFSSLGELVKILVNNYQTAGSYKTVWNGKDEYGKQVSSGVYFYRMNAEGFTLVKKMVMVK